ncbi:NAD(P)H-hydrate dehydratase [Flavobacteriales bacterium]|nr:NAD(P)H-hydrate dehydratase [Flavobacteriales bacterium]
MNLPKVISAEQCRKSDAHTIESEPISSIDLMERAVATYLSELLEHIQKKDSIVVVCGCGNNGGDGFDLAKTLIDMGFNTTVYLVKYGDLTEDAEINFNHLEDVRVYEADGLAMLNEYDVIVDALFGSGINRIVDGDIANWIDAINVSQAKKFSIDLPSGLFADSFNEKGAKVNADFTFTFQRPKRSFFDQRSTAYVGEWMVLDIGLDEDYIQNLVGSFYHINEEIETLIKNRFKHSHKGTYGKGLLIGGSAGMMGTAVLSGEACLRSGIGLLSIMTPSRGEQVIQSSLPEALWIDGGSKDYNTILPDLKPFSAVAIGPGISTNADVKGLLQKVLKQSSQPLVIDADAINIIAEEVTMKEMIPEGSILTPHPKEFSRLIGSFNNDEEKWQKQVEFSKRHKVILLVKGAYTSISDTEGNIYWNSNGNPGMATGGSGDVLTGMILSLLAQGYSNIEATVFACYQHGKAGDIAKSLKGEHQMLSRDIIASITF